MKLKIYFIVFALLLLNNAANSQKDKTLFFGLNVGVKLANKNYALRYCGGYQDELYYALTNPFNYNELYIRLGDKNFYLPYDGLPQNIRYSPGIVTGVTIGYQVSPNFQMSIDGNFSKLKVKDGFTVVVDDPSNQTSQNIYALGQLYAEESRFDGRYNLDYVFDSNSKIRMIAGISGMFTAWRMDTFWAMLKDYKMSLYSVHNPNNNFFSKTRGVGWGGGVTIGCEYQITPSIVGQLVYQPYQTKVDYGFSINKRFILQHDLTLRLLWK